MPKITLIEIINALADAISCSVMNDSTRVQYLDKVQAYIDQETPDPAPAEKETPEEA